jgi:hypothetical protein
VAVLDATTAAVLLDDGARRDPAAITDEDAFRVALEWLKSGVYPSAGFRRGARGTPAGGVAAGRR